MWSVPTDDIYQMNEGEKENIETEKVTENKGRQKRRPGQRAPGMTVLRQPQLYLLGGTWPQASETTSLGLRASI